MTIPVITKPPTPGHLVYQTLTSEVSAKSLVIDLLSTMPPDHPVAVGALVRAAAMFGIGENSMRVALARLRTRSLVKSDKRGFYSLSRAAYPVNHEVRGWATVERGIAPWDGSYIAVETGGVTRRSARVRDRALRLLGFKALTLSLQIRPNNLVGDVDACRERLLRLGFKNEPIVFRMSCLDLPIERLARGLWDVEQLNAGYNETRERLSASALELPGMSSEAAMIESFCVGGEAVRQIVLDPLLPEEIVNAEARAAMINEMRRYDRLGREAWKEWAGTTVSLEHSPVDTGTMEPTPKDALEVGTV